MFWYFIINLERKTDRKVVTERKTRNGAFYNILWVGCVHVINDGCRCRCDPDWFSYKLCQIKQI